MACFVPFNNRNLDTSFFIFRPTVVLVDDLVDALKHFCLYTESLGCVHSSLFRSIHGNMVIWYAAWMKRSDEQKEILNAALLSMLTNVSSLGILLEHSYYDAYAGESRDGSSAAKFSTGDIISINAAVPATDDTADLSYACLALFKSCFVKMDGVSAGVCLNCQIRPRVANLFVWNSLHSCYSWILNSDYRKTMMPYLEKFSIDLKYDIFRVVYVSSDSVLNFHFFPPHKMLGNGGKSEEESQLMQN